MTEVMKALMGAGGAEFSPLDLSGLRAYYDIGDPNSYSGSGTTVSNIAIEGAEPDLTVNGTFNVVGTDEKTYLESTSSMYLTSAASLGADLRDLHNNSADWTVVTVWHPGTPGGPGNNDNLWGTYTGHTGNYGAGLSLPGGDDYRIAVRGNAVSSMQDDTVGVDSPDSDWQGRMITWPIPLMTVVGIDEAAGATGGTWWQNHIDFGTFDATYVSTATTNSAGLGIFGTYTGGNKWNHDQRFHAFLVFNRQLTDTELRQLWDFYRPRISTPGTKELWRVKLTAATDDNNDWAVNEIELRASTVKQVADGTPVRTGSGVSQPRATDLEDADTATFDALDNVNTSGEGFWAFWYDGGPTTEFDDMRIHQSTLSFTPSLTVDSSTDLGETWVTEFTGSSLTGNTWEVVT